MTFHNSRLAWIAMLGLLASSAAAQNCARLERTGQVYATIQAAIGAAVDGDVISLCAKTYNERLNLFSKNLTFRGPDPNDPAAVEATVINGSGTRKLMVGIGSGAQVRIIGITLANSGDESARPDGGIQVRGGSLELIRCLVRNNADTAIWCESGLVTARSTVFRDNSGAQGGAVRVLDGEFRAYNCRFERNLADEGGAVYGPSFAFQSDFIDNTAGLGGAVAGSGTFIECVFAGNLADLDGGGALAVSSGQSGAVVSCRFRRNSAAGAGGAVRNAGTLHVANSAFVANSVGGDGARGGAVANLSGGVLRLDLSTLVANSASMGVSDSAGGAVYNEADGGSAISNSIAWFNFASSGQQISDAGSLSVRYSLISGGWPGEGNIDGDPLFTDARGPDGMFGTDDDDLTLSPGSPCIDAGDNEAVPADFADLDGNGNTTEPLPLDLARDARFQESADAPGTGRGVAPFVDMGAFEHPGVTSAPCLGDWDGDGRIWFQDVVILLSNFGRKSSDPTVPQVGDMNGDGGVDLLDLLMLLVRFGEEC